MRTIRLDAARLCGRAEAMDLLEQALELPDWWGRNLDALHDCLTDLSQPVRLELENRDAAAASFFGRRLLRVLEDSARENPCLELADGGEKRRGYIDNDQTAPGPASRPPDL